MEKPIFMTFKECKDEYGFGERELRALLNRKGCPVLPRRKKQKYRINQQKFAEWINNQTL
ncbi:hypothetical protein [Aminipila sp.]|uniref:hypothetical protein n=1 Tax=Aminipila sp. TaxID=2060095 RepID=UPI00289A44EB|nr:hypothetical protein [Aminipila sp.]